MRDSVMRIGAGVVLALAGVADGLRAERIPVPNGSFETPATEFVTTQLDEWQKTPEPAWYGLLQLGPWDQLTGIFLNLPPADPGTIVNCDAAQAMFLFGVPEVGFFQDYDSIGGTNTAPTHAFDARFEVGKAYRLTVGVLGGGANMRAGVSLRLRLYYRDGDGNRVTVASTNIVFDPAALPPTKSLVDSEVATPIVASDDAWAGRHIGIELLSTVSLLDQELWGGFWDLDNVRLTAETEAGPTLTNPRITEGQMTFTLQSEPGLRFEVSTADDLGLAPAGWSSSGPLTNSTGTFVFVDPTTVSGARFYRVRQLP